MGRGQVGDRSLIKIPLAHQPPSLLVFSGFTYGEHLVPTYQSWDTLGGQAE